MFNITEEESREWFPTRFGQILIKIYDDEIVLTKNDLEGMLNALEESRED